MQGQPEPELSRYCGIFSNSESRRPGLGADLPGTVTVNYDSIRIRVRAHLHRSSASSKAKRLCDSPLRQRSRCDDSAITSAAELGGGASESMRYETIV